MIPIFRKLRKQLAEDNKPLKYFRYAAGEIVLVVIGILIALQINNWNEARKTRLIEKKTLKEIYGNLNIDLVELQSDIDVMDSIDLAGQEAIEYIQNHDTPSPSFGYKVYVTSVNPHFNPVRSGYSLLNSKGLDIISNDSLRGLISRLYELNYPYYAQYENERVEVLNNMVLPAITRYFSIEWSEERFYQNTARISQHEYHQLKRDSSFIHVIHVAIYKNKVVQNRAQRIKGHINDLIHELDKELNQKN